MFFARPGLGAGGLLVCHQLSLHPLQRLASTSYPQGDVRPTAEPFALPWPSPADCPALLLLTRHTVARLEALAAPKLAAQPNWTIDRKLGCNCGDCRIAQVFAKQHDSGRGLVGWPLLLLAQQQAGGGR